MTTTRYPSEHVPIGASIIISLRYYIILVSIRCDIFLVMAKCFESLDKYILKEHISSAYWCTPARIRSHMMARVSNYFVTNYCHTPSPLGVWI